MSRELGKDGVLREKESETFQLSFYKGNRIRRLIEKNGKPLSEKEQADEDKNVQKRVAEIEKEIAKKEARAATVAQTKTGTPDEDNRRYFNRRSFAGFAARQSAPRTLSRTRCRRFRFRAEPGF
jgi:hypothetical protein